MPCNNHNVSRNDSVVSWLRVVPLFLAAMFAAPVALAVDSGDILVVSTKGEVHVIMKGAARDVRAGSVLELPASLRTGRDGSVELRQGATTVSVGPDTALDFPALERPGAPIDRIQQPRGNAFYNIGKREGRKLRVETPYLVGVVKGTQFNVAAGEGATTISLFEGLLEVHATDESAVIDLKAGEIASRRRGDKSISVIRMDSGKLPTSAPAPAGNGGSSPGGQGDSLVDHQTGSGSGTGVVAVFDPQRPGTGVSTDVRALPVAIEGDAAVLASGAETSANVTVNAAVSNAVDTRADISVDAGSGGAAVDVTAGANVTAGAASADLGLSANVGVTPDAVSADVGVGASVGAGPLGADVSTSTSVDVSAGAVSVDHETNLSVVAGPANVDVSTTTSVDVGPSGISADVGTDVGVSAGPLAVDTVTSTAIDVGAGGISADVGTTTVVDAGSVVADVDTGAAVDVGAGGIGADLTTGTGVDAGPVTADLGTSTAVDVGTGGTVVVDTGAALDVAGTDVTAGVSADADLSSGTVDVGVSVGGVNLGLGLDLGLGADEPATDTGSSTTPATDTGNTGTVDVGGLLDSLLRRPGRR